MITNSLTFYEIERIIQAIIKLENTEIIFDIVSKIFHFPNYKELGGKSENIGIKTTYKGFGIAVKHFVWDKFGHQRIIVEFTKEKAFIDSFINPMNKIVNDLKKICETEIDKVKFSILPTGGISENYLEILYQEGTYNPDWEEQHKTSPLTIAKSIKREMGNDLYIIDFDLTAECFERNLGRTILKEDWREIFIDSAPMWF